MSMSKIPWHEMEWLNPPERADADGDALRVVTRPNTDFWRTTLYGFVRDDGHFLGTSLVGDGALEVTFTGEFTELYDQAGLMLRARPDLWLKAGVELSDGELLASAVVTRGASDWSVAPVPGASAGSPFTIRASRSGDAVTLRYRVGDQGTLRMLRVAYLPPGVPLRAGPMCCSPSRGGLAVRFEPPRLGPPDERLHQA